jgi:hypothetical protein
MISKCVLCNHKLGSSSIRVSKVRRRVSGNVFKRILFWKVEKTVYICKSCWGDYVQL